VIRFIWIGLLSAALPAISAERLVMPVALYTSFPQSPSQMVVQTLQDEVETIMGPLGMRFAWRSLSSARGTEVATELAVITFKGRCDIAGLMPHAENPGALGWTHVSDGVILPFSDIDCDRIRVFLQRDLLLLKADEREGAYGRALGRVLAHELYHIFARTGHHGAEGVAKSAYTAQELLCDEFQFDEHEAFVLRATRASGADKAPGTDKATATP
jgi:hypothetical protein